MRRAAASRSAAGTTPPVGFCGELRMTSAVLGPRSSPSSAGSNEKPADSCRGNGTGVAPAQRIADS